MYVAAAQDTPGAAGVDAETNQAVENLGVEPLLAELQARCGQAGAVTRM